jgi:hypothetical protein
LRVPAYFARANTLALAMHRNTQTHAQLHGHARGRTDTPRKCAQTHPGKKARRLPFFRRRRLRPRRKLAEWVAGLCYGSTCMHATLHHIMRGQRRLAVRD